MDDQVVLLLNGIDVYAIPLDGCRIHSALKTVQHLLNDGVAGVLDGHSWVAQEIEHLLEQKFCGGADKDLVD